MKDEGMDREEKIEQAFGLVEDLLDVAYDEVSNVLDKAAEQVDEALEGLKKRVLAYVRAKTPEPKKRVRPSVEVMISDIMRSQIHTGLPSVVIGKNDDVNVVMMYWDSIDENYKSWVTKTSARPRG